MPTIISHDILFFIAYATLGIIGLGLLVQRDHLTRWQRFSLGLASIVYGTLGLQNGTQLAHSISSYVLATPWSDAKNSGLILAGVGVEWASLIFQFSFAAVGAGLITNAITADKK